MEESDRLFVLALRAFDDGDTAKCAALVQAARDADRSRLGPKLLARALTRVTISLKPEPWNMDCWEDEFPLKEDDAAIEEAKAIALLDCLSNRDRAAKFLRTYLEYLHCTGNRGTPELIEKMKALHDLGMLSASSCYATMTADEGLMAWLAKEHDISTARLNLSERFREKDPGRFFELNNFAAAQGNAHAMANVAEAFRDGLGVPKDMEKALWWGNMASRCGYSQGDYLIGTIRYNDGRYEEALTLFKTNAVERKNFDSMMMLGELYSPIHGRRWPHKDLCESIRWFRMAAAKSHKAYYDLGRVLQTTKARIDKEEAISWHTKAVEHHGDVRSMYSLGIIRSDEGLLEKAARGGVMQAMKELAFRHELAGRRLQAFTWAKMAADRGDADMQAGVAMFYALESTAPDEAVRYANLSMDQCCAAGMSAMAYLYEKGFGVEKDGGKACKLYLEAADKGDARAVHWVINMYAALGYEGHIKELCRKHAYRPQLSNLRPYLGCVLSVGTPEEKMEAIDYLVDATGEDAVDALIRLNNNQP